MVEGDHISPKSAKLCAAQLVTGLKTLHSRNFIHRDMKLENVCIDDMGNVKIIDMGLATNKNNKKHTCCGTLTYMAPEVIQKSKVNGNASSPDWYALGVLMFEVLSGHVLGK